jgi:hypothetical protein
MKKMTKTEVKKVIAVMMATYPNYKPINVDIVVEVWTDMLGRYTYEQVNMALKAYILSDISGFAPSIGQIVEKLQLFIGNEELNEMAAWGLVLKAMRNSIYHSEEEFAKLPPVVQKAVVSPGQLREWAMAEDVDGTWMNVTQSNFMRTYRAELSQEKTLEKLPPDILKLTGNSNEQTPVIQTNQETLSVSEERKIAEQSASPIPERLKERFAKLMGRAV